MNIFRSAKRVFYMMLCLGYAMSTHQLAAQTDTATLILPQQSACLGDTIFVPLTVSDFSDVSAFQFYLGWPASQLEYLAVCDLAIGDSSDVVTPQDNDRLQITWVDFTGMTELTLADGDTLMLVKFVVASNLGSGVMVTFVDSANPTVPSREITVINDFGMFFTYEPHVTNGLILQDQSIALLATATPIDCQDTLSQLSAFSALNQTTYQWSGPGVYTDSVAMPTTDTVGLYTVIGQNGNCFDTTTVEVIFDTITPTELSLMADTINCAAPATIIGNVVEQNVDYQWFDANGSLVGMGGNQELVSDAGWYYLSVTLQDNGCAVQDSIEVMADLSPPGIMITDGPFELSCNLSELTVYATSNIDDGVWDWEDLQNILLSQSDSVVISTAGDYLVRVTDTQNACADSLSFTVSENLTPPVFMVGGDLVLDCSDTIQLFQALFDPSENIDFSWLAEDFTLIQNADSVMFTEAATYYLRGTDVDRGCADTLSFTLTQDTLPPVATILSAANTLDCNTSSLEFLLQGDTSDLDIMWLNSNSDLLATDSTQLNVEEAGFYSVLLTDLTNGCTTNIPFEALIDTLSPSFTLTVSDTLDCEHEQVDLLIWANDTSLSCNWLGINPNCQITVEEAGWYYAEVSNPLNGCISLDSIEVIDLSSLFMAATVIPDLLNCANDTVSLIVQNTVNNQQNEWLLPNGTIQIGDSINVTEAGEYSLFALDEISNCRDTLLLIVAENFTAPEGEASVSNDLSCAQNEAELLVSNLGSNTQVLWTDGESNLLATTVVDMAGTYYLNLMDSISQCSIIDSIVLLSIEEPPLINWMYLSDSVLSCDVNELTLQANSNNTNIEYNWVNLTTNEVLGTNSTLLVSEPQTILLSISDSTSGCMADTLLTIVADLAEPLAQIVEVTPFNCASSEGILAAFQPDPLNNLYHWDIIAGSSLPATPDSIQTLVFETAVYTLLVESLMNGCQSIDTILLTNDAQAPNEIVANVFNPGCAASTGTIIIQSVTGGTAPYTYAIGVMPFSLSTVFDSLAVGNYLIQIEDALGCSLDSIFTIEQNMLFDVSILSPTGPFEIGDEIALTAQSSQPFTNQDSLAWFRNGELICANCLHINDTLLVSATYTLEAYSNDGCTATDELFVPVSELLKLHVPNVFSPNEDGINDDFQIFPGPGIESISNLKIWNRWGGLVYEKRELNNLPETGWNGGGNGDLLPSGVYVYQFTVRSLNGEVKVKTGEVVRLGK